MEPKKQDLRKIYDLLDKLCRNFSPDRHKDVLKCVTSSIAENQQAFLSTAICSESIILSKIKNQIAGKNEANVSVFLHSHEELCSKTSSRFRSSILQLLLFLADMESNLQRSSDSVFTLPVSSRSIEASSSMGQIHRGMGSRVGIKLHLKIFLQS